MATKTAEIMAHELNYDEAWQINQVKNFRKLARNYILE